MKNKPQCFQNNIKSRKKSKIDYSAYKLSPKIPTLSNKPSLQHIPRNKDIGTNRTANCQNNTSRCNCPNFTHSQVNQSDTTTNIPQILAKFASQNQQLAKERHSLFQKNCQLVNKIKQLQNVGNLTKIKSLKSLQVPKQQLNIGIPEKVLSPNIYNRNTNRTQYQKNTSKIWLFDSIKNQSNDKIFCKKSPNFDNSSDFNTTKKKFFTNTNNFKPGSCQYKLSDHKPIKDLFQKEKPLKLYSEQSENILQNQKKYMKIKTQIDNDQIIKKYRKPTSKTQYLSSEHFADQDTKQSEKLYQPMKTQRSLLKKSNVNLSGRSSICKIDIDQIQKLSQKNNISFQTNLQPTTPLWPSHQNLFKKTSPTFNIHPKTKRTDTQKSFTGAIEKKLLKIKQQNSLLRKQLCYFK